MGSTAIYTRRSQRLLPCYGIVPKVLSDACVKRNTRHRSCRVTHHTSFTSGTLAHMKRHQWGSIAHPLCLTGYSLAWLHYRNLASTTLLHLLQILSLSTINWYFGSQRLLHDYRARVAAFRQFSALALSIKSTLHQPFLLTLKQNSNTPSKIYLLNTK